MVASERFMSRPLAVYSVGSDFDQFTRRSGRRYWRAISRQTCYALAAAGSTAVPAVPDAFNKGPPINVARATKYYRGGRGLPLGGRRMAYH